jgi:hypothetical protein
MSGKRGSSSAAKSLGHMFLFNLTDEPSGIKESQAKHKSISGDAASAMSKPENAIHSDKVQRHSQSRNSPDAPSMHDSKDQDENYDAMVKMLDDTDNQLKQSEKSRETKYYNRIERRSFKDVDGAMKQVWKQHLGDLDLTLMSANANTTKVLAQKEAIVDVAKTLLEAFVPADFSYPIVEKFWGAIYLLLGENVRRSISQKQPKFLF